MAYIMKQISGLLADAVADALGKNGSTISELDTTDVVSLGKQLSQMNLLEGFYGALANRITKTVYFVRVYNAKNRNILRDESVYGAFVQKVYYTMPDSVDNATWAVPDGTGAYKQVSPYDVEGTVAVNAKIFGGQGTWAIEIIRPMEQIRTAFTSESAMGAFIDGIYQAVENKMNLDIERLEAAAANTSMALSIKSGKARNLLSEFNTLTGTTLTVAQAMVNADFLRYASKEIKRTVENMGNMSTVFNAGAYETFTKTENMVVECLAEFATACEMYLQSDSYHRDLVQLPMYNSISFWQSSGSNYAFTETSKINIANDEIDEEAVEQGGIICFIHDTENVAAYFGNRRSWEMPNPRSEVMIHGEKAEKGFAVDKNANAYVFYMA